MNYINFIISGSEFAIKINYIKEIIKYREITKVFNTPNYILGIINLRGEIIAVLDIKQFFNLTSIKVDKDKSRIMLIEFNNVVAGFIADSIKGVIEIDVNKISPPPDHLSEYIKKYLEGVYLDKDNKPIVLLDVSKIFESDNMKEFNK